jgi:isopropylmalate/homocitrate/citramalate synthase
MTSKGKTMWRSETVFADLETGEIISPELLKNGTYHLIKTNKSFRKDGNTNIREYQHGCKRSKQLKIF